MTDYEYRIVSGGGAYTHGPSWRALTLQEARDTYEENVRKANADQLLSPTQRAEFLRCLGVERRPKVEWERFDHRIFLTSGKRQDVPSNVVLADLREEIEYADDADMRTKLVQQHLRSIESSHYRESLYGNEPKAWKHARRVLTKWLAVYA
jgi:hypothetical protein